MKSGMYLVCLGCFVAVNVICGVTAAENSTEENEPVADVATIDHDRKRHFDRPSKAGLFEGDIMGVNPMMIIAPLSMPAKKWSNNRLPYEISTGFNAEQKAVIMSGINEFNSKVANLRIVPKTRDDRNYVSLEAGATGSGCSTFVGMQGGKQVMNLEAANPCLVKGTLLHDFMHVSGFWHEQSRTDRDLYINLNLTNVNATNRIYMFQKYTDPRRDDFGEAYDVNSLMHYDETAFAVNTSIKTVTPKKPQSTPIGQKTALSAIDIRKINKMYPASDKTC